jgi:hypothetical protein
VTHEDQEELNMLRLEKADRLNPNVLLLEGELGTGTEYFALCVHTAEGEVYVAEALEKIADWGRQIISFQFHVADKPLSYHALQQELVKASLGVATARFSHAYSDLTGYLWTNEEAEVGGHNVLEQINEMVAGLKLEYPAKAYIALRIEKVQAA